MIFASPLGRGRPSWNVSECALNRQAATRRGGRSNEGVTSCECGRIDPAEQGLHAVVPALAKSLRTSRFATAPRSVCQTSRMLPAIASQSPTGPSSTARSDPIDHRPGCHAYDGQTRRLSLDNGNAESLVGHSRHIKSALANQRASPPPFDVTGHGDPLVAERFDFRRSGPSPSRTSLARAPAGVCEKRQRPRRLLLASSRPT